MKPILQALVLAERVYRDVTGKHIIAGTFSQVLINPIVQLQTTAPDGSQINQIRAAPEVGSTYAYINVTDVVDNTELVVQIFNVTNNCSVYERRCTIQSYDRLVNYEISLPLPMFALFAREPGVFSLDVLWNNEILGSSRFVVTRAEVPPAQA